MSELQAKKEQHVELKPQNQSVANSSTVSLRPCETQHCATVENSKSDFSHKSTHLRNPEGRKLVKDFQNNVFDLLVNKVKWRVKSGSSDDGSATATEPGSLNIEATHVEKQEAFRKKFASHLILKDEGETGCTPGSRAAGLGPPVMLEVDDGGRMEFNPFKLVATLGQKLTLAAQLMDAIQEEKKKEMLAEQIQDEAVQMESVLGAKLNEPENINFPGDEDNDECDDMSSFDC